MKISGVDRPIVVLVDDREENLFAFSTSLKSVNCEVVTFTTGAAAIDYLKSNDAAVVLLDAQMPIMDGFETARRIRLDNLTLPILFVTALDRDDEHALKAYSLGAIDFIFKPVAAEVIAAKVQFFIDMYRKTKELEEKTKLLELSAEHEKALLLETALDAVVGADQNNLVIYWNQHAEKIFGYKKEEVLGKDLSNLIVPETMREGHRRGMQRFISTGVAKIQNRRIEIPAIRKSGEEFLIELTVTSIKKPGGYNFYSFMRDITQEKQASEALKNQFKWLELILDKVEAAVILFDPETTQILFSNRAAQKAMVGLSVEDSAGEPEAFFVNENGTPLLKEDWPRSRASRGETINGEKFIWRTSTEIFEYLAYASLIPSAFGHADTALICLLNVTELKQVEQKLAVEKKKLEAIFYGIDSPLVLFRGSELVYEMANRKYLELISFHDVLGKSLAQALPEIAQSEFPRKIKEVYDTGEPVRFLEGHTPILNPSTGQLEDHYFDSTFARISDESGKDFLVVGNAMDVTERVLNRKQIEQSAERLKTAYEVAEKAKEEAERANQLKSAFLANMSHEIRTPLGAMLGFADLLRDPGLSRTEQNNYVDIMTRNGEQLSVIINDILDLSKVEAGHLTLEFTDCYPERIAADVISLLRVKAKEKDLSLEFVMDATTPKKIVSDPTRLRQVLLNLISNSIKFTKFGSVKIRSYGVIGDNGKNLVCFEIKDTGIGIAEDQKEKIFEMFVQADGSMTRRFGGTGLGLALSRKLASALGGDVRVVQSKLNHGSTFLFQAEDQPKKREENQQALAAAVKHGEQELISNALVGRKVLVVDDAPDNQQLIWRYLTKYGAEVDSAENGLVGYRKALAGNFDIVLMDIQMPEMDGYTATEKLRSAGYLKPIIALTAHAMTEVRKKCLNVGCTDHLTKPINSKELISTVARYT